MRLIDADALKDDFDALAYEDWNQGIAISLADVYKKAANMVENMPTIEPHEIIRCRDCVHRESDNDLSDYGNWCNAWNKPTGEEGFCHLAWRVMDI